LVVEAPRYCSLSGVVHASELDRKVPLQLPLVHGAILEGRVLDGDGRPVPGMQVTLSLDQAKRLKEPHEQGFRDVELPRGWDLDGTSSSQVTSDASGKFVFDGLEPLSGSYQVDLHSRGVRLLGAHPMPRLGPAGSATQAQVVVDLASTCTLTGRMTLNGAPAPGFVSWRGPTRKGGQLAGVDGRFRLEYVEAGHVILKPLPEAIRNRDCTPFPGPWTVEVLAGTTAQVDLPLRLEMSVLAGRVTDAHGAPRANVEVSAHSNEACWDAHGPTRADGRFELSVRAGPWTYSVKAGREPDRIDRDDVLPGTRDLELVLSGRKSGLLRLRVVDAVTRAHLTEFALDLENEHGESLACEAPDSDLTSDPQGWHDLELEPGTWHMSVSDRSDGDATLYLPSEVGPVVVEATGEPRVVEIERERGLELGVRLARGQAPWPANVLVLALDPATLDQVAIGVGYRDFGTAYRGIDVGASRGLRFDSKGHGRVTALRRGPLRFVAFPDTIAIEPAEVVVTGDETAPLEIRWRPR
jgi:hypothetical protein